MTLEFREADHTYWLGGRRMPSVTEIIKPLTDVLYAGINPSVLEAKADLGRRVHLACQLHDEGDLDEASVTDDVMPYLAAWRRYLAESGARVLHNERQMHHPALGYAGTVDRVLVTGADDERGRRVLGADIKTTSQVMPSVWPQLAGYVDLLLADGLVVDGSSAIQLRDDGTYRVHSMPAADYGLHRAAFHGLRAVLTWKERFANA